VAATAAGVSDSSTLAVMLIFQGVGSVNT